MEENNEKTMVGVSLTTVGPWNAIVYKEMTKQELEQLERDAALDLERAKFAGALGFSSFMLVLAAAVYLMFAAVNAASHLYSGGQ